MTINSIRARAPSLRAIQQQLAAHILAAPPDGAAALAPWLALPPGARADDRLAVYAGGYPARLHDALGEQFPALAHLLGGRRFAALVRRFIAAARLPSYSLNDAGAELPEHLERDELRAQLPFLPDLARLEWTVVRAFHAADVPPLAAGALAEWTLDDWAAARLCFQPSVGTVASPWPLRALWEARDTPVEAIDVDLSAADHVLVRRAGFAVVCASLSAGEAETLARLRAGERLGDVIARLAAAGHDAPAVLAWFTRWLAAGMIAGIDRRAA